MSSLFRGGETPLDSLQSLTSELLTTGVVNNAGNRPDPDKTPLARPYEKRREAQQAYGLEVVRRTAGWVDRCKQRCLTWLNALSMVIIPPNLNLSSLVPDCSQLSTVVVDNQLYISTIQCLVQMLFLNFLVIKNSFWYTDVWVCLEESCQGA